MILGWFGIMWDDYGIVWGWLAIILGWFWDGLGWFWDAEAVPLRSHIMSLGLRPGWFGMI